MKISNSQLVIGNWKLEIGNSPLSGAGFSVIEVIFAAALFIILATGAVAVILQGLDSNRLGEEQTVANQYAAEGIEAVRSIKNQSFSNLINSTGTGITQSGSVWAFSGSSNVLSSKYTRVLTVSDVQRDGDGNIVASGGTVDSLSKKITATVSWNFTPTRSNSVVLTSYLTDWRRAIGVSDALLVYADTLTQPKYRTYTNSSNSFSSEQTGSSGVLGVNFAIRTSPTKQEAIAVYTSALGVMHVLCFDGATWSDDWSATVGGAGTTRRVDIAYETNSGDVMVLYSSNTLTTNELGYRTKSGSSGCGSANWSGATNLDPVQTSGIVQWVKMAWDKRSSSNLITAIWADGNSDLSTMVWSGSAWGNEPSSATETSLEVVTTAQDVDDFDVEYESLSGNVMVVWANSAGNNGTNGVRYRTCTGGTSSCTWGSVTTPPTFADDATNLDISANPSTDEIVFASIGNAASDLQIGYWSGSAWTDHAKVDQNAETPAAGSHLITTGWLINGSTTRSIVAYDDNNSANIGYYSGSTGTFTAQSDFDPTPAFGNPQKWYDIQMDPKNNDRLMFILADVNNDLFGKRLVMSSTPVFTWTNSDGGTAFETALSGVLNSPFGFAYWRNP